jgi:hypothetical protein
MSGALLREINNSPYVDSFLKGLSGTHYLLCT